MSPFCFPTQEGMDERKQEDMTDMAKEDPAPS